MTIFWFLFFRCFQRLTKGIEKTAIDIVVAPFVTVTLTVRKGHFSFSYPYSKKDSGAGGDFHCRVIFTCVRT